MTEELNPLPDKERKRILGIVKNLLYGSYGEGGKTDTHNAVARHLKRLNLEYPLTIIFFNRKSKMEDRRKVESEKELIPVLRKGPNWENLKSLGTQLMDTRDPWQVFRGDPLFDENFGVDFEFKSPTD